MNAYQHVHSPRYRALLAYDEREKAVAALNAAAKEHPEAIASYSSQSLRFPSGARIFFRAIRDKEDAFNLAGYELQHIRFDGVFDDYIVKHLLTRARAGMSGIEPTIEGP